MRIVEDGPGRVLLIMPDNAAFYWHRTQRITREPVEWTPRADASRRSFPRFLETIRSAFGR